MQEFRHDPPQFLEFDRDGERRRIAFLRQDGHGPTVVWLGGFRSDMRATKAETLNAWAVEKAHSFLRFDYGGHGESGGRFEDGTISDWLNDALAVIEAKTIGPVVLVGSSMGGWISLLAARQMRAGKLAGLVLIAPAVDFTETLMWKRLPSEIKTRIETEGLWLRLSAYSPEPYPITHALIEDGRKHLLFGQPFSVGCPVYILQGMLDDDVPWNHAMTLVEHLPSDEVTLTLINDGDHRLSRDQDLARLVAAVESISGR